MIPSNYGSLGLQYAEVATSALHADFPVLPALEFITENHISTPQNIRISDREQADGRCLSCPKKPEAKPTVIERLSLSFHEPPANNMEQTFAFP